MLFEAFIAAYLTIYVNAYPLATDKGNDTVLKSGLEKRYFESSSRVYDTPKDVRGDERDFMTEVIDHALHHRKIKPDRWMDFYNNGAKWGHYISPQIHHPSVTNIHDPHFTARLTYTDPTDEETSRNAAAQENHVEAYPGELVSGENSLSKFIAPPVFDEPDASSRDTISAKNKQKENNLLSTPEAAATESSNTRKLVDSLNSFMTPLKVPSDESSDENARTRENLDEANSWGTNDKQISKYIDSESKLSQAEPGTPQYESSIQEIIRHEAPSSRDGLERVDPSPSSISSENNARFEQENPPERQRFENQEDKNPETFREENREETQNNFAARAQNNEYGNRAENDFQGRDRNDGRATENADIVSARNNENPEMMSSRANENAEMMSSRNNENEYREHSNENEHFMRNESPAPMDRFREMSEDRDNGRMHSRFLPMRHSDEGESRDNRDNNNEMNDDSRYNNDYHSPDRSDIESRVTSRYANPDKTSAIEMVQDNSGRLKPSQLSNEGGISRDYTPENMRFAEDREEKMSLLHRQLGKLKKSTVS